VPITNQAAKRSLLAALVLAVAGLLTLVVYILPSVLVGPDSDLTAAERLKAENDLRTTLIQGLGGAILLTGLERADLRDAHLEHADFSGANLRNAD
jgi:hypothetical protein